jgi:hypothetical protein
VLWLQLAGFKILERVIDSAMSWRFALSFGAGSNLIQAKMASRIVLIVALGVLVVVAAILILAVSKPDTFRIERSVTIQVSPEKIFRSSML